MATILTNNKRDHDVAVRLGGEEFVVLLQETALNDAVIVAERIRMATESFDFKPIGCQHGVTISIGISEFPTHGVSPEELSRHADAALYEAKTSGRNRVRVARPAKDS